LIGAGLSFAQAPAGNARAPAAAGEWSTYHGPLAVDRYSPLAQIPPTNVGPLRRVCAFDAPDSVSFQSARPPDGAVA
jgi:glucose dehydrogenase